MTGVLGYIYATEPWERRCDRQIRARVGANRPVMGRRSWVVDACSMHDGDRKPQAAQARVCDP